METGIVSIDRIKRAEIRYFESEKNGVAIPNMEAYAILVNVNGVYVNVVHPLEEINVWGRLPYSNSTNMGEDYGTKIKLLSGKENDGVCYVIEPTLPKEIEDLVIDDTNKINIGDIYWYIANSKDYYVDRISILKNNPGLVKLGKAKKIIDSDLEKQIEFITDVVPKQKIHKKNNNL